MDDTSTRVSEEVKEAISATSVILINRAPFSAYLNRNKNYFSLHEACLKRNETQMTYDWRKKRCEYLNVVDRDIGVKHFRRCRIPGSRK